MGICLFYAARLRFVPVLVIVTFDFMENPINDTTVKKCHPVDDFKKVVNCYKHMNARTYYSCISIVLVCLLWISIMCLHEIG